MNLASSKVFKKAVGYLTKRDGRLARIIKKHGEITFRPSGGAFESLVESILSQQLASAAAATIIDRFRSLYSGRLLPKEVSRTPKAKLKEAGVSPQKITYIRDLAARVSGGEIDLEALRGMGDKEIIETLDRVRGIGPWTAHMLLIFTLGRPDVLPVDDLGIRKAVRRIYSLRELPDGKTIERIAERWHPYCSVAALYLWRDGDGGTPK